MGWPLSSVFVLRSPPMHGADLRAEREGLGLSRAAVREVLPK